jgi:hypothetical protein
MYGNVWEVCCCVPTGDLFTTIRGGSFKDYPGEYTTIPVAGFRLAHDI